MAALAQRSPRLLGALQLLAGALVCGINVVLLMLAGRYFGPLFVVGCPAIAIGVWTLGTGLSNSSATKPPRWWTIGFYACLVSGLIAGLYIAIALRR